LVSSKLERLFPRLSGVPYQITSPAVPDYNCVAWAANDSSRWWWPDEFYQYYWPEEAPRLPSLEAFAQAFQLLGFEVCSNLEFEAGWEKVVIFAGMDHVPTHVARQLPDGTWTSKLGNLEDIKHPHIHQVGGDAYGEPTLILRRRKR